MHVCGTLSAVMIPGALRISIPRMGNATSILRPCPLCLSRYRVPRALFPASSDGMPSCRASSIISRDDLGNLAESPELVFGNAAGLCSHQARVCNRAIHRNLGSSGEYPFRGV